MNNLIYSQLTEYYVQQGIYPEQFSCRHQDFCRSFAYQNDMTETKMSMVGSCYGTQYPKIVVISLDPPFENQGAFVKPEQRTTVYISTSHEADDYNIRRPNPHWAMTQIIIKDILCLFGYKARMGSAVVNESYAGLRIENVTRYFAHVNAAKCSMNNVGKRQAHRQVHQRCSNAYLRDELAILQPDFLVTQGNDANTVLSTLLMGRLFLANALPTAQTVTLGGKAVLWLPMRHPARSIAKIRKDWPFYVHAIQEWKSLGW
ncbi:MAG: hypothetical protein U0350_27380 [Caldilineaceae bacterium]